jgi:hypothetical protein
MKTAKTGHRYDPVTPTVEPPADGTGEIPPEPEPVPASTPARRRALLLAATGLGACAALALGGYLLAAHHTSDHGGGEHTARTVPVAYTVTGSGTADITYGRPDGKTTTVTAHLPWHTTTTLPTGHTPATISITLGHDGGHATCALTLHGTPVQHATANGPYGRATCRANLATDQS